MTVSTFRTLADAIAYTLGEPPERVEWAEAILYVDGETRYIEAADEDDARRRVEAANMRLLVDGPRNEVSHEFVAYQEHRSLPDGTQIVSPWQAPADQFFESR